MKFLKGLWRKPWLLFVLFVVIGLYGPIFRGHVAAPMDTLAGSYYPWLDYKWGYEVGVPVKNPPISDSFSTFYIWKNYSMDLVRNGTLPTWNPLAFSGSPLLASYHWAVFFPANIFFILLPGYGGWNLYILFSTLFAGLSMYFYISRYLEQKWLGLFASVVFSLAGPMTTWTEFGTGVWAAGLLPLLLCLLDKYFLDKNQKVLPIISLVLATLILAGHAQILTFAALILPLYVLYLIEFRFKKFMPQLFKLGLFSFLGVSLSAIQLLPSLSFIPRTIRSQENLNLDYHYGLIPLADLIRLWVADFFGHPTTYNHWGSSAYHEYSGFLGTVSLPFILAVIFEPKLRRANRFFVGVFVASLLLATDNPISEWIYSSQIPLLTYSSASRILFVTVLAAAILLAKALQALINRQLSSKKLIFFALILVAINLYAFTKISPEFLRIAMRNSILPIGFLFSLIVFIKLIKVRSILVAALLLFLMFDLGRYFLKYNPLVPAHLTFPATPAIEYLQNQPGKFRIARSKDNILPPNTWMMYNLEAIEGYDPLYLLSYNQLFNLINMGELHARPSRYAELNREKFDTRYLDALNVKYFVTIRQKDNEIRNQDILEESNYSLVFEDGNTLIYQSDSFKDRVYFALKVTSVNDETEAIKHFNSTEFDPRKEVVLLKGPSRELQPDPEARASLVSHGPNLVEIETESRQAELLILADSFDEGWLALVDGNPTTIYPANVSLRGVFLEPGKHRVVFEYKPKTINTGLKISLLALAALIISGLAVNFKPRSRR